MRNQFGVIVVIKFTVVSQILENCWTAEACLASYSKHFDWDELGKKQTCEAVCSIGLMSSRYRTYKKSQGWDSVQTY